MPDSQPKHGVKDVIKIGQVQKVGHSHKTDDHRVHVVENRTYNHRLKGVAGILPAYVGPRP